MNFLQPWMLAALPLALIPIIIHLINQRRYQSTQWAAMMFLLSANRMNRGYAKIRQWLILALRAMVIAALVFAIGRPIASGLLGGSIAGAVTGRGPANTIVLLDRSPSMQASTDGTSGTKLQTGLSQIAETLNTVGTQRLVLIDSNTNEPRELATPADLLDLPETGPSDASADVPAMLLAALDHINANQLGQTEIWICSDLRAHDWRGDDGRWSTLKDAFAEFGRRVRFRLLAFSGANSGNKETMAAVNRSIRVVSAKFESGDEPTVALSLTIRSDENVENVSSQVVPITFDLQGARSVVDVEMRGGIGELQGHRIVLPRGTQRGHGSVSVPADRNMADNEFYFSFDEPPPRRTVIVTDSEDVGRVLKLASEIVPEEGLTSVAEVISPRDVAGVTWEDVSLVLWHAPLPQTDESGSGVGGILRTLVERGGRVIAFPPKGEGEGGLASSGELASVRWTDWNEDDSESSVSTWRGDADLLAATLSGTSLPVGTLKVKRFAGIAGEATTLASLADGSPLLCRVPTPRGGIYFCMTTPLESDSSLAKDGVVLYVMIQRALQAGAESLGNTTTVDAGSASAALAEKWQRLMGRASALSSENVFVAGVFEHRDEGRLIVVNRSEGEDSLARVSDPQVDTLFGGLPFVRVDQQAGNAGSLVEEIWRAFLILMLAAMIGEACLCLPRLRASDGTLVSGGAAL